jgi:hypothetical protein
VKNGKNKSLSVFGITVLFFVLAWDGTAVVEAGCLIKLKNGQEIKTGHCYEEGGRVFINRFGGYVAVNKSEIAEMASAEIPIRTPAAPAQKDASADATSAGTAKVASKSTKPEPNSKEKLEAEIRKKEQELNLAMRYKNMNCGQGYAAAANAAPDPHVPKTNQGVVSEKTANAFQKHVETKVQAYKADSHCRYNTERVSEIEQELEQLKQKRETL